MDPLAIVQPFVWCFVLLLWRVDSFRKDYQAVEVFRHGDDGFLCYRTPALLQTARGTLVAFANAR